MIKTKQTNQNLTKQTEGKETHEKAKETHTDAEKKEFTHSEMA